MFAALTSFQSDNNLPATAAIRPDDDTLAALNEAVAQTPEGTYIWRTVGDDKVRSTHAELNGTVRKWADSPDPGEDYNCRCWAEPISNSIEKEELEPPKIEIPKIPGTDIPDRGIPEQGWSGSRRFNPFEPQPDPSMDPDIIIIPPKTGPYMKEYKDDLWPKGYRDI